MTSSNDQSLPGVKVLLMGPPNTGKTTSLTTLINAGLEVFGVFMEPGMEVLPRDLPIKWTYIPPGDIDFETIEGHADRLNRMNIDDIVKLKNQDKSEYQQFMQVLRKLMDFVDDRSGESFGNVGRWGTDRVLFFDGITGLTQMASAVMAGSRPVLSQPEIGAIQNLILTFLNKIVALRCHVIMTAHTTIQVNQDAGLRMVTIDTVGQKLAPRIPKPFGDVLLTRREKGKFLWSNDEEDVLTKARNLPFSNALPQNFVPMIERWKERGGIIQKGGE